MVNRKARCGWATHKQTAQSLDRAATSRSDPQNCNVYIGNVSQEVTDAQLRLNFEPFGTVTDVKIYRKGMNPRPFGHVMILPLDILWFCLVAHRLLALAGTRMRIVLF